MKRLFFSFCYTRRLSFKFSKDFIKDTTTQFQNEIGLTDKLNKMVKLSSRHQKTAQAILSVPFIIGVSTLVVVFLSMNSKTRKNVLHSSQVLLALLSANLCSAQICQTWVLNSIYRYTLNVKTSNSPTFLFQIEHYLRRNGIQNTESAEKISKILEYGHDIAGKTPLPKYIDGMIRIVQLGLAEPRLKTSEGLRKLCQTLLNSGDIRAQYLALVAFPDLQISSTAVSTFNSNLSRFKQTIEIGVPSHAYKCSLTKNHILYILHRLKDRGISNINIPKEVKQMYN